MTTIDKNIVPEKPSATLRDDDIKTERILVSVRGHWESDESVNRGAVGALLKGPSQL